MKRAAAVILIGLTVFLTTYLVSDYLRDSSVGDLATQGSNTNGDGSTGGDSSLAGSPIEQGSKSAAGQTQNGGDDKTDRTDAADSKKPPSATIPTPPTENDGAADFENQLEELRRLQANLTEERKKMVEDQNNMRVNATLLKQIQAEKAEIESLKQTIEKKAGSAPTPSKNAVDDSTPGGQNAAGTSKLVVGPQTAKLWSGRWSKLEAKERIYFVRKLAEAGDGGLEDVIVILQQMTPGKLAETLAQLAKDEAERTAEDQATADTDSDDTDNDTGLAARLVMKMMEKEKEKEKGTQKQVAE